jgi:hypothetical protein
MALFLYLINIVLGNGAGNHVAGFAVWPYDVDYQK